MSRSPFNSTALLKKLQHFLDNAELVNCDPGVLRLELARVAGGILRASSLFGGGASTET